jgi:hypothetical protein
MGDQFKGYEYEKAVWITYLDILYVSEIHLLKYCLACECEWYPSSLVVTMNAELVNSNEEIKLQIKFYFGNLHLLSLD